MWKFIDLWDMDEWGKTLWQPAGVGGKIPGKVCPLSAWGTLSTELEVCVEEKVRSKLIASVFALNEVKYVCGNDGLRMKKSDFFHPLPFFL